MKNRTTILGTYISRLSFPILQPSDMDFSLIYSIAAGSIFFFSLSFRLCQLVARWIRSKTIQYLLKHIMYPFLLRRTRVTSPITRSFAICTTLYWSATAAANIIGVRIVVEAGNRAAILSIINLVPLVFTSRLSLAADLLGSLIQAYRTFHASVG